MRIVHITDIDLNAKGGGMNTVILEVIRRQIISFPDEEIVLYSVNKAQSDNNIGKIPIVFKDEVGLKYLDKTDLVVFHSVYNLKFIPIYHYLKKINKKYIIVSHGSLSKVALRKGVVKKMIFRYLFLDRFIRDARRICFTTKGEQQNSICIQKPFIIIPNPINKPILKPVIDKKITKPLKIVYISKIDYYYKGLDILINALKKLNEDSEVEINIYGYGQSKDIDVNNIPNNEKDVKRLLSEIKDIKVKTQFHGPIFGEEKYSILRNSDIYILTSRSEAMPLSITEALSLGVPCIVSNGTNMSEMIEENNAGWKCNLEANDVYEVIVKALSLYHANPLKYRAGAFALYKRLEDFDIGSSSIMEYKNIININ